MNSILEIRSLCKSYLSGGEPLEILAGLDLRANAGAMIGITGISGSGKSTLLHLIGGMDRPGSGSIKIMDREITGLQPAELSAFRNKTIGFVFQFHHLLPEFSALENVMMPLLLRGNSATEAAQKARKLLDEVDLAMRMHHRPGELSGGEQQRVAIARALIGNPLLLLADEPTGNLDPHTGQVIADLLQKLHAGHNLTSILVTHNEKLAGICSRTYHLENGRLHNS